MPFVLIFIGSIMVAAGVRGKTTQLYTLVKGDIEGGDGTSGYIYWMLSILVIGAIGYIKDLEALSRAFLVLVIIVLLIGAGKRGFFQQFNAALAQSPTSTQNPIVGAIQ